MPETAFTSAKLTALSARRQWLQISSNVLAVLLIAYGIWLACIKAFQGFQPYDDEGYLLSSVVNFVRHGGLYTTTFAQYGPFFFNLQHFMHWAFHLSYDHDGGRVLTLTYWLCSAAFAALFVLRLTAHSLLSAVGFFATLMVSTNLIAEPGHPQEVILTLLQAGLCLSLLAGGRLEKCAAFFLGGVAACLCLTKINVGVFFLGALYFFYARRLAKLPRWVMLASSCLTLCFPAFLMRTYLSSWAFPFCLFAIFCLALFLLTLQRIPLQEDLEIRELLYPLGGLIALSAVVLGVALLQHLSPHVLLEGIVLAPLNHPRVFFYPLLIERRAAVLAGASGCIMLAALWSRTRWPKSIEILTFAKLCIGPLLLLKLVSNPRYTALYLLPLVPLLLVSTDQLEREKAKILPRVFLCAMLAFQLLQAYPVAGSQLNVAVTPAVCWALLLFWDGACGLAPISFARRFVLPAYAAASLLALLLGGFLGLTFGRMVFDDRAALVPLDLTGARRIQVSRATAGVLQELTSAASKNCQVLYSMPGMFSFNFWSHVPTPNGLNMDGWMTALSHQQQAQIVAILASHKNACVIYSPEIVRLWMPMTDRENILAASPLSSFIKSRTKSILKVQLDEPVPLLPRISYDLRRVERN